MQRLHFKEHKRRLFRLWESFIDKLLSEFIYDFSVDEIYKERLRDIAFEIL